MIVVTVTSRVAVLQRVMSDWCERLCSGLHDRRDGRCAVACSCWNEYVPQVIVLSTYCEARDSAVCHRIQLDTPESF